MAQNITQRFPFSNKGVVQKIDINQLQDGQYSFLLNTVSEQEGSLSPRYGHINLTGSWSPGPSAPAYINSLHVTQTGATSDPTFYLAAGSDIYRKVGTTGTHTRIAESITVANKRIGMSTYKTDQVGTTGMTYLGTAYNGYPDTVNYYRGMLRDNGTDTRYWGILPPAAPATITPSAMTIVPVIANDSQYNPTIGQMNVTRITGTITSATEQPSGSKFYKIILGSVTGSTGSAWLPGMFITDGSSPAAQSSVIEKVDSTGAVFAYFNSAPLSFIKAYETAAVTTTAGQVYTATSSPAINADLSFGSTEAEGYVTDDTVAFSFYTSTPQKIYDIRLRFYVNGSSYAYYEKAISPGAVQDLQNAATVNSTTNPDNPDGASYDYNTGVIVETNGAAIPTGDRINYDTTQVALNPAYLTPSKSGVGAWSQVEISKRSFLAVGGAGNKDDPSGSLGWKNITSVEVIVRPVSTSDVIVFKLGSIFAYGGKGINSNYSAKLTPYSYVYTYKNSITGAESNPSIEMIPENSLNLVRQGINVNVLGAEKTGSQSFNTDINKICIYRAGGTFTDGLYRRVGVIDNPGATAANFVDTADDLSIVGAPIAEFDNDAPITSDIGQEYKYNLNATDYSGTYPKGSVTVKLKTISSGLRDLLTPGTVVNIGGGIAGSSGKQESCVVLAVSGDSFTTYFQYEHKDDEAVIWDTNAGIAADVICSAFNRMWVAGDAKNPHILYSSKTGRPESFPVINQGTGNPHVLAVSSPDNPINGIAEFNGELVCLCQNGIYTVRLDNGRLVGPFKTPANRGLVLKYAWGYIDNEIWFLSNDGIYAWGGGSVRKVTFPVDFIFNNKVVNDIGYFNRVTPPGSLNYYQACNIQQKGNEVFFNYINSEGWFYVLRYHILFDRWSIDEVYDPGSNAVKTRNGQSLRPVSITALCAERASNKLYAAKTIETGTSPSFTYTASLIDYDVADLYTDNAGPIYYEVKTKFYDMGAALTKKNFTDIGFEFTSGVSTDANNTFFYKVYYDYSSNADDASSSIPYTQSRQVVEFPLQQTGSPLTSAGKEARAAMFSVYGLSKTYNIFHNFAYTFIPLSDIIKGRVTDWDDLGHPFDKRLFNLTIEYDNNNKDLVLYLDTVSGVSSCTTTLGVQTITLPAKSGRAKTSVPINTDIIAKLVRIRPKVATDDYQIFNYSFQKDDYPRDTVNSTDWSDLGYQYEKRLYQLYVNCDTNGYNVSVGIEADGIGGASVLQTVTVNGTNSNRMQPIALNKDLIGKLIRLKVSAIPAVSSIVVAVNTATVTTTSAHGLTNGSSVSIFGCTTDVDLNGTYTATVTGASTFTVTVANVTAGTYNTTNNPSLGINSKFQLFDFKFDYESLPKPTILSTPWNDFGYDYLKYAEQISFDVNTNNQPVPVGIYGDGTLMQTVTVTGAQANRNQIITLNPALTFRTMRLEVGSVPAGGRFQLWDYRPIFRPADKGEVYHTFDWDDLQYPYDKKLTEVTIEFETGAADDVKIALDTLSGLDGTTQTLAFQTLTLPNTSGVRGFKTFAIDETVCKMIRIRAIGSGNPTTSVLPATFKMYGYKFGNVVQYPADIVKFTDWSDLGYQYEKRLYQLYVNCDTNNQNVTVNIEGDGTILQTVTINGTATNRMQPIAINKDLIGKLIRLNVVSIPVGGKFQLFDFKFDYENLPKPIILSTPWTDFGYDYMKYAEQITFDVNTNGYQIPVDIYCDGNWKQRVVVEGTQQSRNFNCTLNPAITFQTMRLQINPDQIPSGGRFQLWEYKPVFRPSDKGPVYHTFDWDNLDHPYDKKISEITIEFETNGKSVDVVLDTLTGVNGNTENLAVHTFTLNSTGRGYKTFPIPETICKMVRLRSVSTSGRFNRLDPDFKMWGYRFGNTVPYPPDIQRFSEWSDLDYPCDKIFRGVGLSIDTGGVDCTVTLEVDGVAKQSFTVNTTSAARQVFLTAQNGTEIIGKMYRLTFTPGAGGKAQVFGAPQFNTVKDSCPFVFLDSYEQGLGSAGYSVLKQFWADYKCDGDITIKFYNEENVLFYSKTLGPHASRDVERFYLPSINGSVINKSKKHRITIEAVDPTKPFKWYRDTSRLEYINLSSDQRQGYFQFIPWTNMQLPV